MAEKLTRFDYLLNAFEQASQSAEPARRGYAQKRRELLAHVRDLEADQRLLEYAGQHFAAASFADEQIPDRTVLKITVPHHTPVSVDLRQTLERGIAREERTALSVRADASPETNNP